MSGDEQPDNGGFAGQADGAWRELDSENWECYAADRDLLLHSDHDRRNRRYRSVRRVAPECDLISPTLPFRAPLASFFVAEADGAS